MQNLKDITTIPLRFATLCIACDCISNANGNICPACGSRPLCCLQGVLDRPSPIEGTIETPLQVAHA